MRKLKTIPARIGAANQSRASFPDSAGGAHASHYGTAAHKAWARAVLERAAHTCQECGKSGGRGARRGARPAPGIREHRMEPTGVHAVGLAADEAAMLQPSDEAGQAAGALVAKPSSGDPALHAALREEQVEQAV